MDTPDGYTIRPALAGDIPVCNAIELEASTIFPAGSIPEYIYSDTVPEEILVQAVQDGLLWIAIDSLAQPAGYGLLQFVDGLALLAQMDVRPAHGRKGLGTALVRKISEVAREQGATDLYLTTFTHVSWNAPFYARLGFVEIAYAEQPPGIRRILAEERGMGLENRTAMRLHLDRTA